MDVFPTHYNIRLEPNLETFEFLGRTEIFISITHPIKKISINAVDLKINQCKMVLPGSEDYQSVSFSEDPDSKSLIMQFSDELSGDIKIMIEYTGKIRNDMRGFYRSRYEKEDKMKYIAITQFEEIEARKCFPCFDHPRYKATFDIEMIIDKNLEAISNTSIEKESIREDGKKIVKFYKTVKMSTYLLFFGVGEFEFVEDQGDVLVRVATTPGKSQYADVGLKFSRKALEWFEDYYGIKYPLKKLDNVAVADFAFGAMENWGAITYRENLILYYPGKTSRAGLERIYEVISHETAHMWFGNLVTPEDWKYLWLNESFASLFGYAVSANFHPDWGIWDTFALQMTSTAYARDSLLETFPIELPGGEQARITQSTAPILYNKGASVVRMLESYLGEGFRKGINHYLTKFRYSTASSDDFWASLEEVSKEPISDMMVSWVKQPGYPMIEVNREKNKLNLKQVRFTYLPLDSSEKWIIPLKIWVLNADGKSKIIKKILHEKSENIELEDDPIAYKINYEQTGFYRVKYLDLKNLNELGKLISSKKLSPLDRWGIQNDFFSLAQRGDISITQYIEFINYFMEEDSNLPLISVLGHLLYLYNLVGEQILERIKKMGKSICEKTLEKLGYVPKPGELHTISNLRNTVIWVAVVFGSQKTIEFVLNQFANLKEGRAIHEDIIESVLRATAYIDDTAVNWLMERFEKIDNEPERINVAVALGSVKRNNMVKALDFTMKNLPDRIKFYPIIMMTRNPSTRPFLWEWFVDNIKDLERFHPSHFERTLNEIVQIGGVGREKDVTKFFESYQVKEKTLEDVIKMSLEELEINRRFLNKILNVI